MEIKRHNTAGCFLIRNNNGVNEILLIYKRWAQDNQGWVPPKGHIEKGEILEQTAMRETTEETGYKSMRIIRPLDTKNIEYPWNDGFLHKKTIHYFLAELISDEKVELKQTQQEKDSTIEVKWHTFEEALKNLKFDDERETLRGIMQESNLCIKNKNYE